jgi:hypothetical protein
MPQRSRPPVPGARPSALSHAELVAIGLGAGVPIRIAVSRVRIRGGTVTVELRFDDHRVRLLLRRSDAEAIWTTLCETGPLELHHALVFDALLGVVSAVRSPRRGRHARRHVPGWQVRRDATATYAVLARLVARGAGVEATALLEEVRKNAHQRHPDMPAPMKTR